MRSAYDTAELFVMIVCRGLIAFLVVWLAVQPVPPA